MRAPPPPRTRRACSSHTHTACHRAAAAARAPSLCSCGGLALSPCCQLTTRTRRRHPVRRARCYATICCVGCDARGASSPVAGKEKKRGAIKAAEPVAFPSALGSRLLGDLIPMRRKYYYTPSFEARKRNCFFLVRWGALLPATLRELRGMPLWPLVAFLLLSPSDPEPLLSVRVVILIPANALSLLAWLRSCGCSFYFYPALASDSLRGFQVERKI